MNNHEWPPATRCCPSHSICSWCEWFCTYVAMTVWVMWNVVILRVLISIPLPPVAGDCLSHSSLSPRLLAVSLYIYVLLSVETSPGRCIALGGTRDYVLYSLSLSYSPSHYFSSCVAVTFLLDVNSWYQADGPHRITCIQSRLYICSFDHYFGNCVKLY